MNFPGNLLYAESHEWVKEEGKRVTIGITDYAQGQLKDIVYVELPEIGAEAKKGESIGVVESVKTVADLFSPVTGKVVETNVALKDSPQFINEDPYGKGWIVKIEIKDKGELKGLLSSKAYQEFLPSEAP
jgi:glycine cleavage system H protein